MSFGTRPRRRIRREHVLSQRSRIQHCKCNDTSPRYFRNERYSRKRFRDLVQRWCCTRRCRCIDCRDSKRDRPDTRKCSYLYDSDISDRYRTCKYCQRTRRRRCSYCGYSDPGCSRLGKSGRRIFNHTKFIINCKVFITSLVQSNQSLYIACLKISLVQCAKLINHFYFLILKIDPSEGTHHFKSI